jgi:transcriptional regulator with XRE-family HTH domain
MNTIGERLRELRGSLNQEYVAEKIGVSQSTYSSIENGRAQIRASAIIALAKLHGVTADYILGLDNKVENEPLEQEAQESSLGGEALAAIVNNMGQMTALQNTLTELWIEQEERIKSLENNFKAMAKALNGIGKIWD